MIKVVSAAILAAALAAPLAIPTEGIAAPKSASRTPEFNTAPTCSAAGSANPNSTQNDRDVCMKKEKDARAELDKQWASFPAADRSQCISSTGAGGIPSYVELYTCLEMNKQVRELAKTKTPEPALGSTTGKAPRSAD